MVQARFKDTGTHERLIVDGVIKGSSDRSFGFVIATVFAIVGLWPLASGKNVHEWALALALFCLVLAVVRPALLAPLNRLWFKFGLLLNRIVSPLVMGLLFYLIITPFALFMRLTGKDLLHLKHDPKAQSYWILREPPGPSPETIKNQY